ncbi:MAG: 4'-phosphopantetheinyl transferase superfamily protein [Wenzhouxiangellaceae bacterium]
MMQGGDYVTKLTLERADGRWLAGLCLSCITGQRLADEAAQWLHPGEYERFKGFAHNRRAHDYLRGRYAVKKAVKAMYPDLAATAIHIESGIFQQPVLSSPLSERVDVSISHTSELSAAVAFPGRHPLAIDVESVNEENRDALLGQISPDEQSRLSAVGGFSELERLTALWTAKEALSKALGCGMTTSFCLFKVNEIEVHEDYFVARFEHFMQYRAMCFRCTGVLCTLLLPDRSRLLEQNAVLDALARTNDSGIPVFNAVE